MIPFAGLKVKIRVNEGIRSPQVRLIGPKGEQWGVVDVKEGLRRAREEGLDLVEVAPTAQPPVCRILDFGKYLYALNKKEKESRKKHKVIEVKEIKLTSKIEEHDYQTKLNHARRFLEKGNKVKLSLWFRGREITHIDLGEKVLSRFTADLAEYAEVERNSGLEGKVIHIYLTPKASKAVKKGGGPKHAEAQDKQSGEEKV